MVCGEGYGFIKCDQLLTSMAPMVQMRLHKAMDSPQLLDHPPTLAAMENPESPGSWARWAGGAANLESDGSSQGKRELFVL